MVKCCIVGCISGNNSNHEKVPLFSVPKDVERRKVWAKAIPRKDFILTEKHVVCVQHFREDDLIRYWKSGNIQVPYTRIKLNKEAVPSIFPSFLYASESSIKRKESTVRCAIPKKIKFSHPENHKPDVINTEIIIENVSPSSEIHFNLFDEIAGCSNLSSMIHWPLASPVCNNSIQNNYCFVSFCSGDYFPVIEKSVMVNKSGKITFGIFGQEVSCTVLGIIPGENINLLADNIKEFETINICHGGPRIEEFPEVSSNVCTKSTTGRLKHNQCLLVIKTGSTSCQKCRSLRNTLNMQEQRMVSGIRQLAQLSTTKKF